MPVWLVGCEGSRSRPFVCFTTRIPHCFSGSHDSSIMDSQIETKQTNSSVRPETTSYLHPGERAGKVEEGPNKENGRIPRGSPRLNLSCRSQRRKRLHPQRYDQETGCCVSAAAVYSQTDWLHLSCDSDERRNVLSETSDDDTYDCSRSRLGRDQTSEEARFVHSKPRTRATLVKVEFTAHEGRQGSCSRQELQLGSRNPEDAAASQTVSVVYPGNELMYALGHEGKGSETGGVQVNGGIPHGQCLHGIRPRQQELQLNDQHPDCALARLVVTQSTKLPDRREEPNTGYPTPGSLPDSDIVLPAMNMDTGLHLGEKTPPPSLTGLWPVQPCSSVCEVPQLTVNIGHPSVNCNPIASMNQQYTPYLLDQLQQNLLQRPQFYVSVTGQHDQKPDMQLRQSISSIGGRQTQPKMQLKSSETRQNQQEHPTIPMNISSVSEDSQSVGVAVIVQPRQDVQQIGHFRSGQPMTYVTPVQFATHLPHSVGHLTHSVGATAALGLETQQNDSQTNLPADFPDGLNPVTALRDAHAQVDKIEEVEKHSRRLEIKRQKYRMKASDPMYMDHVRAKKRERYHARRQDPGYVQKERQKKRERYHRARQNPRTVEKTREKKRELYYRARRDPDWVNKTREKKRELYYRARQDPNWITKTRGKKKEIYHRARQNPDWVQKTREKKRDLYHRARQDPLYVERQRARKNGRHGPAMADHLYGQWVNENPCDPSQYYPVYPAYTENTSNHNSWRQHGDRVMDDSAMVVNALLSLQHASEGSLYHAIRSERVSEYPIADGADPWYVLKARKRLRLRRLLLSQGDVPHSTLKAKETCPTSSNTAQDKVGSRMDIIAQDASKLEIWKRRKLKRKHVDVVYRAKRWARLQKQKCLLRLLGKDFTKGHADRITKNNRKAKKAAIVIN